MTHRPHPPVRVLRSLLVAILLGMAVSIMAALFNRYYLGLRFPDAPLPTGQARVTYLKIHATAGAGVGAGLYAGGWPPKGWLRMCLFCTLCLLLTGGDVDDYARWSLDYWLE